MCKGVHKLHSYIVSMNVILLRKTKTKNIDVLVVRLTHETHCYIHMAVM